MTVHQGDSMLNKLFAIAGAVTFLSSAAYAGQSCCATKAAAKSTAACCAAKAKPAAAKKASAPKKKLVEVLVCPIAGEKISGKGSGSQVVGNYNVHFCCAGCQPAFNKLTKAEQQEKIKAALKTQNAGKKAA